MTKRAAPIIAAIALLTPIFYVGSYCALVRPAAIYFDPYDWNSLSGNHYRYGGSFAAGVYWPIERIDRKLRPQAWDLSSVGWSSYPPLENAGQVELSGDR